MGLPEQNQTEDPRVIEGAVTPVGVSDRRFPPCRQFESRMSTIRYDPYVYEELAEVATVMDQVLEEIREEAILQEEVTRRECPDTGEWNVVSRVQSFFYSSDAIRETCIKTLPVSPTRHIETIVETGLPREREALETVAGDAMARIWLEDRPTVWFYYEGEKVASYAEFGEQSMDAVIQEYSEKRAEEYVSLADFA